jgi:hypothetical protein
LPITTPPLSAKATYLSSVAGTSGTLALAVHKKLDSSTQQEQEIQKYLVGFISGMDFYTLQWRVLLNGNENSGSIQLREFFD